MPGTPETDEATRLYLNALDYVLDDFVIEAAEQDTLDELAATLDLTPHQRREVHAAYFQSLVDAAQRDNVITAAEHRLLQKVHAALMLPAGDLPKADEANISGSTIPMGTSVCFSGEAFMDGRPGTPATGAIPFLLPNDSGPCAMLVGGPMARNLLQPSRVNLVGTSPANQFPRL